ncbi:MAG TPA: polysaccharide biosynthesis protein, partial [Acidisarcina sp.]
MSSVDNLYPYPHPSVVAAFQGRTVLVTGAAGSIGAELARQVSALPIGRLLLLDRDENSMFDLMRSFEGTSQGRGESFPEIIAVVGDIRDQQLIRHTFARWPPDIVLHAAAYKHVSMMEANPCEAVLNNVTGTRIVADAAIEFHCERVLLISSDKAVQPVSVMGATKRLAELVVQARASFASTTRPAAPSPGRNLSAKKPVVMASVRFVNVIGSRGSVLPIFREQIDAGGPVTITDERMTRFFMPVKRAVSLLLEAATLNDSGSIYALETGQPINIMALARDMIEAAGLVPGNDIAIEITGIRPGERLHERLHSDNETLVPTAFPG